MSNFAFLQAEFPAVFEAARQAETRAHGDPRAACFYARRTLELALHWLYRNDPALRAVPGSPGRVDPRAQFSTARRRGHRQQGQAQLRDVKARAA